METFFRVIFTTIVIMAFLIWIVYPIYNIETTITEMNDRQKTVVVTQHKAIEDMIKDVCKR